MNRTRAEFYTRLLSERGAILEEAEKRGAELGLPEEVKGKLGTSGAASTLPGIVPEDVMDVITKVANDLVSPRGLGDELRRLVKSVYGDDYDVLATNSCESALRIVYGSLIAPPMLSQGDTYRARCIGLLERHTEHHLSYGAPFPAKYKDLFSDRGNTAGELGVGGRRMANLDIVMVPMAGARYQLHGPKMIPAPLLLNSNADATVAAVAAQADIHAACLTGFITLGYDTVGYGYGELNVDGVPKIQAGIGGLAQQRNLPYIVDNAWGTPFIGSDPRKIGADVLLYSMDKVTGAPISGLVIGKENPMVNVRHAAGVHSERFGNSSSHGKAAYSFSDPGKMTLAALVHVLRSLRDTPERYTSVIDKTYEIALGELAHYSDKFQKGFVISKSYNLGGVEINYENSWAANSFGIPMFTYEDRIANVQVIAHIMDRMGVHLIQAEDGNILLSAGLGTLDHKGNLNEKNMQYVVKALFAALSLAGEWSGKWFDE